MTIVGFLRRVRPSGLSTKHLGLWFSGVALIALRADSLAEAPGGPVVFSARLEGSFIVAQLPAGGDVEKRAPVSGGMLRAPYGGGARLVVVSADGSARILTSGFHSACDPDVSFDATRILFAGKQTASDPWNIYEMAVDGTGVRQITADLGDCRSPSYQSTLYTLKPLGVANEPEYHLTFVAGCGTMNEYGGSPATHLYSCKLDGSAVRRLTFNLSSDMDPLMMDDGRLVFAAWQRSRLDRGLLGRIGLFGVNIDGSDYALYAGFEGKRVKHMPCATAGGLVVFVEADRIPWDGAGHLSCVTIRRPLQSYRPITAEADGLFHSPSPLADGRILVSRRPADGSGTHGVWRFDPQSRKAELVFDDPRYHEIHARLIHPRNEPDGRSTAVPEEQNTSALSGKFFCLSVYASDLERSWMAPGSVKRLRVLEGVPGKRGEWRVESGEWRVKSEQSLTLTTDHSRLPTDHSLLPTDRSPLPTDHSPLSTLHSSLSTLHSPLSTLHSPLSPHHSPLARYPGSTVRGIPPLVQRRILGEIPVEQDGSFNIEVPANTSIELQILDADGMALRSCGWIWVKDYARQGCIGCHEDGELVPENSFAEALQRPSTQLCLPPERRRTVDFRRDVMPILAEKCAPCHGQDGKTPLALDGDLQQIPGPDGKACFNRSYESLLARGELAGGGTALGKYVHPGRARTSPLIWRVFGRNTSRRWDAVVAPGPVKRMPPGGSDPLGEDEKRTLAEWIDLGALWDGIPAPDDLADKGNNARGENP